MRHKKITGIILRLKPHLEFDRHISVFSCELGHITVIAKGVRKIHSHRSFHLDLLNVVHMELETSGMQENSIYYLREVSTIRSTGLLSENPHLFANACLISAFLTKILPDHAPQKELFTLTQRSLALLPQIENNDNDFLSTYFLKALRILGYLPNTMPRGNLKKTLASALLALDPQFTLTARRTLGIFSKLESRRSS